MVVAVAVVVMAIVTMVQKEQGSGQIGQSSVSKEEPVDGREKDRSMDREVRGG